MPMNRGHNKADFKGGERMKKKYVIELTKPVWPRHIADEFDFKSANCEMPSSSQ
jgi:hypothetical protein